MTLRVCPVCGKQFEPGLSAAMPFCCERCRRIDLHRWLGEKYSVPAERSEDTDEPQDDGREPGAG